MQVRKRREEDVRPIPEADQVVRDEDCHSTEGDDGE
jgi:hypothetical protein